MNSKVYLDIHEKRVVISVRHNTDASIKHSFVAEILTAFSKEIGL